jgi:UDP-N-acetylmuramoyl-tripeptide--D-alanyl-D-alanine ligase
MSCEVVYKDEHVSLMLPGVLGVPPVYSALAALAVAVGTPGTALADAVVALSRAPHPPGRMRILPAINGAMLIDDSYNSSPAALEEALATLGRLKVSGKKIAVLGDMLELGEFSVKAHNDAGHHAAEVVDQLITVGVRARAMATQARASGLAADCVHEVGDATRAAQLLAPSLAPGDVVLIKGSQSGIRLERVVRALMEEPERAGELLVRQEEEWLAKK